MVGTMNWKKRSFGLISLAAVIVVLFSTCLILPARATTSDPWLDPNWGYRKQHVILGSTAGEQTNYPVKITVRRATGTDSGNTVYVGLNCKSDFSDIRFTATDGVTPLSYWIEEVVAGGSPYAVFWVKIPSIPVAPGSATIYLYYGNPLVSTTSDIDATFDMACDMEEGDLTDWDGSWGTSTQSASTDYPHTGDYGFKLIPASGTPTDSGQKLDVTTYDGNHAYRIWLYDTGCTTTWWTETLNVFDGAVSCMMGVHGEYNNYTYCDSGAWLETNFARSNGWHFFEFRCSSDITYYYIDDTLVHTSSLLDESSLDWLYAYCYRGNPNPSYFDDAIVRKWVDPEPSHGTWGSEESDIIAPSWDETPSNQIVDFGTPFSYDVNASDASGIASYWVNDTDNFAIDSNGIITNVKSLVVGTYGLKVRAYDPYGHYCSASIKITVDLPTTPTTTPVIPGFPFEAMILGILISLGVTAVHRRKRKRED